MDVRYRDVDFSRLSARLEAAVAAGAFPGCAAAVGRTRKNCWYGAFGVLGEGFPQAVRARTLYDLASLTKVVATAATAMSLLEAGLIDPARAVSTYLEEFRGEGRDKVTLLHLLTHTSGLPAWRKFHASPGSYQKSIDAVIATPLEAEPGTRTVYSDLGAMLIGECLVRAGGKPLATLARTQVFEPLAMRETFFRPPANELQRIAPTELDKTYRKRLVHGEVHDENAHAMGGVSAHAGLFSTVEDLARFATEILDGRQGKGRLWSAETVRTFTTRQASRADSDHALLWMLRSKEGSSSGHHFSAQSFGHTGFTGTSIWFDPERELFAILLSNRVHPSRKNQKIREVRVAFHDAIVECLGDDGCLFLTTEHTESTETRKKIQHEDHEGHEARKKPFTI